MHAWSIPCVPEPSPSDRCRLGTLWRTILATGEQLTPPQDSRARPQGLCPTKPIPSWSSKARLLLSTDKAPAVLGHRAAGRPTHSVALRLTNRIRTAELSSVGCVHITVPGQQQLYWIHFDLLDAGQLHNLEGGRARQRVYPHDRHTDTQTQAQARQLLRSEEHAQTYTHQDT